MIMYRITADTDNLSLLGHAMNINGFLARRLYYTPAEALAAADSHKRWLNECGGYGRAILDALSFSAEAVEVEPRG